MILNVIIHIINLLHFRLTSKDVNADLERNLDNWLILKRFDSSDGNQHMGLLLLISKKSQYEELLSRARVRVIDDNEGNSVQMQAMKLEVEEWRKLKIGFFYTRITPTWNDLAVLGAHFLNTHLILADMNLSPTRDEDHQKLATLCGLQRVPILHEMTFPPSFSQLDHIFLKTDLAKTAFSTSFINHSSDHRTITVRIPLDGSAQFTRKFREEMHFDRDHWTRKRSRATPRGEEEFHCNFSHQRTIDQYLDVLRFNCPKPKCIVYDISFAQTYMLNNFTDIDPKYKDHSILSAETLLFPFYFSSPEEDSMVMYALVIWSKGICKVVWPYLPDNVEGATKAVTGVIDKYLKELYECFKEESPGMKEISQQVCENSLDNKEYWVYLLTVLKKFVQGQTFNSKNFDSKRELSTLEKELRCQKLFFLETPPANTTKPKRNESNTSNRRKPNTRKRSHSPEEVKSSSPKRRKSSTEGLQGNVIKTFQNKDLVSCWLNSSIQVCILKSAFKECTLQLNIIGCLGCSESFLCCP